MSKRIHFSMFVPLLLPVMIMIVGCVDVAFTVFSLVKGYSSMQTCSTGLWVYTLASLCICLMVVVRTAVTGRRTSGSVMYSVLCALAYIGILALTLASPDKECGLARSVGIKNISINLCLLSFYLE
jgi:hypothetical protein